MVRITKAQELSPTQRACLTYCAKRGGAIERRPGGFWVAPEVKQTAYGCEYGEYYGTTTVGACVVRGWLRPDDEPANLPSWKRVYHITTAGIAALTQKGTIE